MVSRLPPVIAYYDSYELRAIYGAVGTSAFGIGLSLLSPNCWISVPAVER